MLDEWSWSSFPRLMIIFVFPTVWAILVCVIRIVWSCLKGGPAFLSCTDQTPRVTVTGSLSWTNVFEGVTHDAIILVRVIYYKTLWYYRHINTYRELMYADILTWLKLILSSSISLLLPASFLAATSLKFRFFPLFTDDVLVVYCWRFLFSFIVFFHYHSLLRIRGMILIHYGFSFWIDYFPWFKC